MRNRLYLALRYLLHYRARSVILVLALTSLFYLPLSLRLVIDVSEDALLSRSEDTPLVLGNRGSEMDLVLGALYFKPSSLGSFPRSELRLLEQKELAEVVPLHYLYTARDYPVVGTSPAYFERRDLVLRSGTFPLVLGECVVGSVAAERLGLKAGDTVVTDPEHPYHLAGSYPLELRVTGILAPSHSWDDRAFFTDIKTAWVIQGLGHGHENLNKTKRTARANASLPIYNRISSENADSFHFHGEMGSYPVSAALVFPRDAKAEALLLADYGEGTVLLSEPDKIIRRLLDTLFRIRDILGWVLALALSATTVTVVFILALTVRMRRRESMTLYKIGGSASMTLVLTGLEILILSCLSFVLALLLLLLTWIGRDLFLAYLVQ
jgi:putative ABC transport system permease protein